MHGNYDSGLSFDPDSAIAIFKDAQLKFEPGVNYNYSTFGFILAGAVIEYVLKARNPRFSYEDYINRNIVSNLDMDSLRPDYSDFDSANVESTRDIDRVLGYRLIGAYGGYSSGQALSVEPTSDVSWKLPGGGWISNIHDLALFAQELLSLTKGVLSEESRAEMWRSGRYNYGLGFYSKRSYRSGLVETVISHGGNQQNSRTQLTLYPNVGLGIVFMSNSRHVKHKRIVDRIHDVFVSPLSPVEPLLADCPEGECREYFSQKQFSGIWQEERLPTILRRRNSEGEFRELIGRLAKKGWFLTDVEIHQTAIKKAERVWVGVFQQNQSATKISINLDSDLFQNTLREYRDNDYSLVDVETYLGIGSQRNKRLWTGVFVKNAKGFLFRHDLSSEVFLRERQSAEKQGFSVFDIEEYINEEGERRWSFLAEVDSSIPLVRYNYNRVEFFKEFEKLAAEGYYLVDIESYLGIGTREGQQLWAGVWRKGTLKQKMNRNMRYPDLINTWHKYWTQNGFELVDLEQHF